MHMLVLALSASFGYSHKQLHQHLAFKMKGIVAVAEGAADHVMQVDNGQIHVSSSCVLLQ